MIQNFLICEGYLYDLIVGYPTIESLEGVLDLRNLVASFVVEKDKIALPMEPDYVQDDPGYTA